MPIGESPAPNAPCRFPATAPRFIPIAFFGLLVVAANPACHRRSSAPAVPTSLPSQEAGRILEELDEQARAVARYQAVLKVRGRGPEGRFSATQVVIFERPHRVRVELLGAFGATRWVAIASEEEILVWFPGRREFLRETDVERVVGALLGVELTSGEVIAALSGAGIPLEGRPVASAVREGERTRIEVDGITVELEESQVRSARRSDYRVAYPTLWKRDGRPAPDQLEIVGPELQASLRIEDLDVNVRLHPEAFLIELPEEARQLELAQIEGEAVFVKTNP